MKLRQLFEKGQPVQRIAIQFGRFNPFHPGHKGAWEAMNSMPGINAWYVGTNPNTHGPKDPLPADVKIKCAETLYPTAKGHIIKAQDWFALCSFVYEKHSKYGPVELYYFTDEKWVQAIEKQNGKEGRHGFYQFAKMEWKSTERPVNTGDVDNAPSGASALRAAVINNDRKAWETAAGEFANAKIAGKDYFDIVQKYLSEFHDIRQPEQVAEDIQTIITDVNDEIHTVEGDIVVDGEVVAEFEMDKRSGAVWAFDQEFHSFQEMMDYAEAHMGGIVEASYEGNLGFMEVAKFMMAADEEDKDLFRRLVAAGQEREAWELVQAVTGTKLRKAAGVNV